MFTRFIRSVRSRPAHERRILATTVFLSASAIIIAIWITSLARTLGGTHAADIAATKITDSESAAIAAPGHAIASPFETLEQSMQQIAEGVREIRRAWDSPGAPGQEAEPVDTTPATMANDTMGAVRLEETVPPAGPGLTGFRETTTLTATTTSALAAMASARERDEFALLADRVAPPPTTLSGSDQNAGGLWAAIGSSISSISQTITNAYNAIFE